MINSSHMPTEARARNRGGGFTLIEMMVSVVILVILMAIIFQIMQLTSSAYKQTTQGTGTMQQARVAFERMTRTLSQATLNTYYSYYYAAGATTPSKYFRQSELQFVSGYGPISPGLPSTFITSSGQNAVQVTHAVFFQAPLGVVSSANAQSYGNLGNLLNACGYFVTYGPDPSRPSFLSSSGFANAPPSENRFRLMEYLQPSENLSIYTSAAPGLTGALPGWISLGLPTNMTASSPTNVRALANNIVALIIMPEQFTSTAAGTNGQANTQYISSTVKDGVTSATSYAYDSAYNTTSLYASATLGTQVQWTTANQLPPLVKVIMVAVDEASGARLAAKYASATSTSPPDLGNLATSTAALFQNPSKLHTAGATTGDLEKFQDVLNATPGNVMGNTVKCNYYVFQTDLIIRGAKWTQN